MLCYSPRREQAKEQEDPPSGPRAGCGGHGGARGIGRATAQALITRGAKVSIGDVDVELAKTTAEELGHGTVALPLDVTDRESFAAFLDETEKALGPVDVVINNAGIMPIGKFSDETESATKRQLDINLLGVINGSQLALDRMLPRDSGHVVNIASQAGKAGFPGLATYCATKHAVVGLCQSLYWELEDTGVEVSVVMPAIVNTELSSGMKKSRLVKSVEPEDVADSIATALEYPDKNLEVFVPKEGGTIGRFVSVLPLGAQKRMFKLIGGHKVAAEADAATRARYEDRVSTTPPAALPVGSATETALVSEPQHEPAER